MVLTVRLGVIHVSTEYDRFDGKCTYGCNGGYNGDRCNLTGITLLVQGADLSYVCAHLDSLYGYFRILIYNTQISTG